MVGVKGKYKGCNTCRNRRVACDNTRPFCKKCTDHGRVCEGYEQQTVFIVGTIEDKGRCASHPPRNISKKKIKTESAASLSEGEAGPSSARSRRPQPKATLELKEIQPPGQSWDTHVRVASVGGLHRLRFVAIHARLGQIQKQQDPNDGETRLRLPPSRRADVRPTFVQAEFKLTADGYIHLPRGRERQGQSPSTTEGLCLFLYEHNSSAFYNNRPHWKDAAALSDPIRQMGPSAFRSFPAHHFFTRIYRPNAIFASLLNRQTTTLASPDWHSVPWELSPKTALDRLLDTIAQIPTILSRSDRILSLLPSIGRRLKANDLLSNCASIERQFETWYAGVEEAARRNPQNPLLFWPHDTTIGQPEQGQMPFEVTYDFPSSMSGLAHVYYWTGLIVLYGAMARLAEVVLVDGSPIPAPASFPIHTAANTQPGAAAPGSRPYQHGYGHVYEGGSPSPSSHSYASSTGTAGSSSGYSPYYAHAASSAGTSVAANSAYNRNTSTLPPSIHPAKYQTREIRRLAAHVCRSLDWTVGRSSSAAADGFGPLGQPDLVAAPLHIVERFYEDIGCTLGDGELERLWCRGFRERLELRSAEVENMALGLPAAGASPAAGGPVAGAGSTSAAGAKRGKDPQVAMHNRPADAGFAVPQGGRGWIEIGRFGG
ncbi:hypothetical protein JX266_009094 [Neoarthrinium moseri]|uniref:uncharacterized protein n=1 Tax=Neoarthrinium moseri TaxID=1658444 RepID=UPI001FDC83EF|nr:uncharacterized protein JN550_008049 [Neoarthrinium moseri]KAI1844638.1 hypothetical protein JX266_009094 [Neoarthrinium moseri]KAI1866071.1 hypothetical protein JN550_008049 [Neoarthrinium moseri]